MKKKWFRCFLVGLLCVWLMSPVNSIAEVDTQAAISGGEGHVHLDYVGDRTRLGVGVDDEGDISAEALHVFGQSETSAFIAEGWIGQTAGGLKLNYHWSSRDEEDNVRFVNKFFIALDQNDELDRKATLGMGLENETLFAGAYLSTRISDERQISKSNATQDDLLTGQNDIGFWQQTQTTSILTRRFAKAYDYGVGARIGRYMPEGLWRFRVGVDYERGDYNAEQLTFSAGLEKFISDTGHSLALNVECSDRSGDFDSDYSDTHAMLVWRYAFGESYRPAVKTHKIKQVVSTPAETVTKATDAKIIKHKIDMKADAYFDLDSSELRKEPLGDLRQIADLLAKEKLLGKISLVGHTCDLASHAYNQALSERRAYAVKEKLIGYGVPAEKILTEGRGETQPRYPNDREENRRKNRRVDIHFLKIEEKIVIAATPPPSNSERIEWTTEVVEQPPAWPKRAMVNTIQHKRRVDVYQYEITETVVTTGNKVYTNRLPITQDDSFLATRNGGASMIDVLANDRDDDGHPLTITGLTQPAAGSVENFGELVSFTPATDFDGDTEFTYTVSDGQGGEATATVRINVINNPPTVANDSATTQMNQSVSIDVLANDSDPNGDTLTLTGLSTVVNGSVEIQNGQVLYQPNDGFLGRDNFTYTVRDVAGATALATVTVLVSYPNNPPIANDDFLIDRYRPRYTVNVLANDSDPDGDSLVITRLENLPPKTVGKYQISTPNIIFSSGPGWDRGKVTITYFISDGRGGTASAELSITDP